MTSIISLTTFTCTIVITATNTKTHFTPQPCLWVSWRYFNGKIKKSLVFINLRSDVGSLPARVPVQLLVPPPPEQHQSPPTQPPCTPFPYTPLLMLQHINTFMLVLISNPPIAHGIKHPSNCIQILKGSDLLCGTMVQLITFYWSLLFIVIRQFAEGQSIWIHPVLEVSTQLLHIWLFFL